MLFQPRTKLGYCFLSDLGSCRGSGLPLKLGILPNYTMRAASSSGFGFRPRQMENQIEHEKEQSTSIKQYTLHDTRSLSCLRYIPALRGSGLSGKPSEVLY